MHAYIASSPRLLWESWIQDGVSSYVKRSHHGHEEQLDMRTVSASFLRCFFTLTVARPLTEARLYHRGVFKEEFRIELWSTQLATTGKCYWKLSFHIENYGECNIWCFHVALMYHISSLFSTAQNPWILTSWKDLPLPRKQGQTNLRQSNKMTLSRFVLREVFIIYIMNESEEFSRRFFFLQRAPQTKSRSVYLM